MLGRRRSWILVSQIFIIIGILGMALTNPIAGVQATLERMALFAVLLGFSSATQDIAIDAYRIESDSSDMQALLSSTYIAGYRIGMIVAGAGALLIAGQLGSNMDSYSYEAWRTTYIIMAASMLVGVVTTFVVKEPTVQRASSDTEFGNADYVKFLGLFAMIAITFGSTFFYGSGLSTGIKASLMPIVGGGLSKFLGESSRFVLAIAAAGAVMFAMIQTPLVNRKMVDQTYLNPIKDFFQRYGASTAVLLLALVGLYRISDIVLGVISNVFYQDLGFTKPQIAGIVKTFGLIMTLLGGFLGGLMTIRFGVIRILFWGALLSALTNVLFMALAYMGNSELMLYVVISADNLAAGLASAAFVAFLSSLTNVSFTAVQYAIFTSLMTLFPKLLGGYSGTMVESMGYANFFAFTAVLGLPILWLVWYAGKKMKISDMQLS
ncbi:MAG: MFS transporter [Pseudomonadota bacterium]